MSFSLAIVLTLLCFWLSVCPASPSQGSKNTSGGQGTSSTQIGYAMDDRSVNSAVVKPRESVVTSGLHLSHPIIIIIHPTTRKCRVESTCKYLRVVCACRNLGTSLCKSRLAWTLLIINTDTVRQDRNCTCSSG